MVQDNNCSKFRFACRGHLEMRRKVKREKEKQKMKRKKAFNVTLKLRNNFENLLDEMCLRCQLRQAALLLHATGEKFHNLEVGWGSEENALAPSDNVVRRTSYFHSKKTSLSEAPPPPRHLAPHPSTSSLVHEGSSTASADFKRLTLIRPGKILIIRLWNWRINITKAERTSPSKEERKANWIFGALSLFFCLRLGPDVLKNTPPH